MTTFLFVCTGNTCRSPMAAAIATQIIGKKNTGLQFRSAGIAAKTGAPITKEAGMALCELEIPFSHFSQPLTGKLLAECDHVFVMENHHLEAVADLNRSLPAKFVPSVSLLGGSQQISDPLGKGLPTYRELARHLVELVQLVGEQFASRPTEWNVS